MKISVIISTYNWPSALNCCLQSLLHQTDDNYEIIIADDGSEIDTTALIQQYIQQTNITIKHVFQADKGFRLSKVRNKAAAACLGEYLIFMDGDCIARPNFVANHRRLAANGYFVAGNRVLLREKFTHTVFSQQLSLQHYSLLDFVKLKLNDKINRLLPVFTLPLGPLRFLQPLNWRKAAGCNTAFWKQDILAVNGYDELFKGWGYEDSDLLIRLMHNGIKRKEGRFSVPVFHLWHKQNDQSQHDENYKRLMQRLDDPSFITALQGINQYITDQV